LLGGCIIFNGKRLTIINAITYCFFLTKIAYAKDISAPIQLTLKPNICVLSGAESQCEEILVAEWKAQNDQHYSLCLFQRNSSAPIECWKNANFGAVQFTQTIAATTIFELRDSNNRILLGQQAFQVINAHKKFRRSRRNPWSFF
jgi:hypothetical protein